MTMTLILLEKKGGEKRQELRALIGATHGNTSRIGYQSAGKVDGAGSYSYSISGSDVMGNVKEEDINHSTKVLQADSSLPTTLQPYEVVGYMWIRRA